MPNAADFEKLGVFYLGRPYDWQQKKAQDGLILYDSKDLVTHAVCVGMTGSGKTGLCLALIEEVKGWAAANADASDLKAHNRAVEDRQAPDLTTITGGGKKILRFGDTIRMSDIPLPEGVRGPPGHLTSPDRHISRFPHHEWRRATLGSTPAARRDGR